MRINSPKKIFKNIHQLKKYGTLTHLLRIDICSACQLKCPCCIHSTKDSGIIKDGFMAFEKFKLILDNYPAFNRIEISNWGEPFLNPDFDKILEYAYEKKVILSAKNGSNFNTIKKETLENLVEFNFEAITISIDGTTQEVYEIYRRNGSLEKVLNNIKMLNSFKEQYNSNTPVLKWQFIVFGHNEHQIESARKMAKEYNMDFILKLNFDPNYSPVQNEEILRREIGASSREEYWELYNESFTSPCSDLWTAPQINWDGKLLGCCVNQWKEFGNIFEHDLNHLLTSPMYLNARKAVCGLVSPDEEGPCLQCPLYKKMKTRKQFYKAPSKYRLLKQILKK